MQWFMSQAAVCPAAVDGVRRDDVAHDFSHDSATCNENGREMKRDTHRRKHEDEKDGCGLWVITSQRPQSMVGPQEGIHSHFVE